MLQVITQCGMTIKPWKNMQLVLYMLFHLKHDKETIPANQPNRTHPASLTQAYRIQKMWACMTITENLISLHFYAGLTLSLYIQISE